MKDDELIEQMREAVTWIHPLDGGLNQAINDDCLRSLANMAKQHFVEQACDATIDELRNYKGFRQWHYDIDQEQRDNIKQAIREKFK